MDVPRISVVMPSFNQVEFLEEAIASVLGQGYPELEFLVLDGGSTDGSAEIIDRYGDDITWSRSHPDAGQASAIREGFERATGDILCWLNSDDRLADRALHKVAEVWTTTGGGLIIVGACQLFSARGLGTRHLPRFTGNRGTPTTLPEPWILDLLWHWSPGDFFYQPEVFFPAEAYVEVGGVDPAYHFAMDYDLWIRFARASVPVVVINETLAWFRQHAAQKTEDTSAVYRELAMTANEYVARSTLPASRRRRLALTNRAAAYAPLRRAAQLISLVRHGRAR